LEDNFIKVLVWW